MALSRVDVKETCEISRPKSKPHFFSSDKRKTEVLKGYCRDDRPSNIYWAEGPVQGCLVVCG